MPTDDEGDQPADDGDDEGTGAEEPDQETIAPAPSDSGDDGGSALGFLPHTGLELAAMAAFGLVLVLMGTVLLRVARARRPKALR